MNSELILVLTTESSYSKSRDLSYLLLNKKLICCVNLKEIESHYWWEGTIVESKEVQLSIKTKKDNLDIVLDIIHKSHSYETPEILYFPISVSKKYANWAYSIMD